MSPCLPEFQRLLLFFPLAGSAGAASEVSGNYWTATRNVNDWGGYPLSVTSDVAYVGNYVAYTTGCSVRCVRAREEQAVPCFFPLSGWPGAIGYVGGRYWSTTVEPSSPSSGYCLAFAGESAQADALWPLSGGYTIRCVRAREEQAIPRF